MKSNFGLLLGLGLMSGLAWTQSSGMHPAFEVASVKLNTVGGFTMVRPPSGDNFTATNVSLKVPGRNRIRHPELPAVGRPSLGGFGPV